MKRIVLLTLTFLGLSACAQASYKNVSVQDLKTAQNTDSLVLDVRTTQEFAEGHVPGAKLIPVQELEARVSEVPTDKAVFVICRSGNRSKTASELLVKTGRNNISNVEGGTLAWVAAGYPIEK